MRDDDLTLVELVHRELRDVRWPEPTEIRTRARRRSRRTAVAGAAAVLVVASVSAVVVGRAGTPADSPVAGSGTAVGGRAEIPVQAMLDPADVPVKSDERLGDTGLGERVRVDDVLRTCAQEQGLRADDSASRYSRSQTLVGAIPVDGFAPYRTPVISQDVYRLEAGAARQVLADLDRRVAACTAWQQVTQLPVPDAGTVTAATVVHSWTVTERDFAGDQAVLLRHTVAVQPDPATGKAVGLSPPPEEKLVVRVGDLVAVLVPGEPLRRGVPGNTLTEAGLLDIGRAAAGRMCAAANPGC